MVDFYNPPLINEQACINPYRLFSFSSTSNKYKKYFFLFQLNRIFAGKNINDDGSKYKRV